MIVCYMFWLLNSENTHIYHEKAVICIVGLGVRSFLV
jgi:hypothetical protein